MDATFDNPLFELVTNQAIAFAATATGVHNVQGGVSGQQGRRVVTSAGGTTYVRGITLGADISQLTPRAGDHCINTNASAVPGPGLVTADGTAWRRVARQVQSVTSNANATAVNVNSGNHITSTLVENTTMGAPTNVSAPGERVSIVFTQDATGGRTVAWNAAYILSTAWSNSGNTANKKCFAEFVSDGSALVLANQSAWY